MKIAILKLTAFGMLAAASSVYASEEAHAVRSLRGSTSASSDEDSADEELYGWRDNRDWSRRSNGTPWSVRSNGTPWSVQSNGQPWGNNNNGNGWWNGNNRSNNLQTCRANCQCPGGEQDSHTLSTFLFLIFVCKYESNMLMIYFRCLLILCCMKLRWMSDESLRSELSMRRW